MRPELPEHGLSTPPRAAAHVKPNWDRDGHDWPNRASSRFVEAAGLRWHVQEMGQGPVILLVHGTGAATHSWRTLAPLLAQHFTVVAPDLPGHGFTETPPMPRLSLNAMAADLSALMHALGHRPVLVAGHSAGAAVLARMCLDGRIAPGSLIGLNGAMLPIGGVAGRFMTPFARMLAASAVVPRLFARFASREKFVERMIAETGSALEPDGVEFYRRLTCSPGHVAAAIRMMANWRLRPLARDLPRLGAQSGAGHRQQRQDHRAEGRDPRQRAGAGITGGDAAGARPSRPRRAPGGGQFADGATGTQRRPAAAVEPGAGPGPHIAALKGTQPSWTGPRNSDVACPIGFGTDSIPVV